MSQLKVCEEFISIQGEGRFAGKPSYFIRLHGCNLRCHFCDSKFSFDGDWCKHFIRDIKTRIDYYQIKHIVITGGEPFLQIDKIIEFINAFDNTYTFEFETNGTVDYSQIKHRLNCFFNISPKLQFDNKIYVYHNARINYKFVHDGTDEVSERIVDFIESNRIGNGSVYIMPECQNQDEQKALQGKIVSYCLRYNFNYCHRIHIAIWNDKKGV